MLLIWWKLHWIKNHKAACSEAKRLFKLCNSDLKPKLECVPEISQFAVGVLHSIEQTCVGNMHQRGSSSFICSHTLCANVCGWACECLCVRTILPWSLKCSLELCFIHKTKLMPIHEVNLSIKTNSQTTISKITQHLTNWEAKNIY